MRSEDFYSEAIEVLMIYGHTFEWVITLTTQEQELINKFEKKTFEKGEESEIQKSLIQLRVRYDECYPQLKNIKKGDKLHTQFFNELIEIKNKIDLLRDQENE